MEKSEEARIPPSRIARESVVPGVPRRHVASAHAYGEGISPDVKTPLNSVVVVGAAVGSTSIRPIPSFASTVFRQMIEIDGGHAS
jgi:hypothetical protein